MATEIPGVNTFFLSASDTPVPDITALAASNPPGQVVLASTGVFAVATANIGVAGTVTGSADTGSASLPVTISVCETDPATSACVNPAVPTTAPFTAGLSKPSIPYTKNSTIS